MNRMLSRCLSQFHFSPTETSKNNLLKENVREENIVVTGNTVIDALKLIIGRISNDENLRVELAATIKSKGYEIKDNKRLILITGHRRENFGEGFINICNAIKEIAIRYPDVDLL